MSLPLPKAQTAPSIDAAASAEPLSPSQLADLPGLQLEPVREVQTMRGLPMARDIHFGQILVTGPPGAGKSTVVRQLGGWPQEGYIDLTQRGWWRSETLALRPREVHLGFPFVGNPRAIALFDDLWRNHWTDLVLDLSRVELPRPKRHLWSIDWIGRFAFEFLLPPPERIYADRCQRARDGTHPVDQYLDLEQIRAQVAAYCQIASHFHHHGLRVGVRQMITGRPLRLCAKPEGSADAPA